MEHVIGQVFGRLTVIGIDEDRHSLDKIRLANGDIKQVIWHLICKCECGTVKSVSYTSLKGGTTTSCGCYHREVLTRPSQKKSLGKLKQEMIPYMDMIKDYAHEVEGTFKHDLVYSYLDTLKGSFKDVFRAIMEYGQHYYSHACKYFKYPNGVSLIRDRVCTGFIEFIKLEPIIPLLDSASFINDTIDNYKYNKVLYEFMNNHKEELTEEQYKNYRKVRLYILKLDNTINALPQTSQRKNYNPKEIFKSLCEGHSIESLLNKESSVAAGTIYNRVKSTKKMAEPYIKLIY